jgi:uncharacterized protein (DUF2336 family)
MSAKLTATDVDALLRDRSAESRASAVRKIATEYADRTFSPRERQLAEEIFRLVTSDLATEVRKVLSSQLKDCPDLAHDVARALANDVEQVALPIIRHSMVLTDQDLIEIVSAQGGAKRQAIAARDTVSADVADAIVDTRDEGVIATLVANPGADMSEASMEKTLNYFGDQPSVAEPMALRARLPIRVAERLVHLVSEQLQEHLVTHHEMADTLASNIIMQSRERATLGLVTGGGARHVEQLVASLSANRRLTDSIILRALYTGDMAFFEAALARRAGIPMSGAVLLIRDKGKRGLEALVKKAGIADALIPALRVGVEVCNETDYDGGEDDRERRCQRVIERLLTQFDSGQDTATIGAKNVEYLLAKLRQFGLGATAPRGDQLDPRQI